MIFANCGFDKYKDIFIFGFPMSMVTTLQALKAAAEETRLRLLTLLEGGEASVGELVVVLQQSQPRVSRHLKLLVEAGLVENFRDRHHVYYRLASNPELRPFLNEVLAGMHGDVRVDEDQQRLAEVRQAREKDAYRRIDPRQASVEAFRPRAEEADIFTALDDALEATDIGDLLNVKAAKGNLLMHLALRSASATGVDRSQAMRLLARTKVQEAGLAKCTLRNVDGATLPFAKDSFDTVLLNEALSREGNKSEALAEAARVLRRDGRLLILDWIQPVSLRNTGEVKQSGGLAENQLRTLLAEQGLVVSQREWLPGKSPDYALFTVVSQAAQQVSVG